MVHRAREDLLVHLELLDHPVQQVVQVSKDFPENVDYRVRLANEDLWVPLDRAVLLVPLAAVDHPETKVQLENAVLKVTLVQTVFLEKTAPLDLKETMDHAALLVHLANTAILEAKAHLEPMACPE